MSAILGIVASSKLKVSGAYESIATITGTGSAGSITFSSIPSTYKHLQVRVNARSTVVNTNTAVSVRVNGDTGTNYSAHSIEGSGSSVGTSRSGGTATANIFRIAGANASSDINGVGILDIIDYASTTKNKTLISISGYDNNGDGRILLYSAGWYNTSAITSLEFYQSSGNFTTTSTFSLYGIKV